jgi:hypothetical protein
VTSRELVRGRVGRERSDRRCVHSSSYLKRPPGNGVGGIPPFNNKARNGAHPGGTTRAESKYEFDRPQGRAVAIKAKKTEYKQKNQNEKHAGEYRARGLAISLKARR